MNPALLKARGSKDKVPRTRGPRFNVPSSTCRQRSGVVAAEAIAQPAGAPAPPAAEPEEVADVQTAARAAVLRTPEEDVLAFPFLGDEVRIGEQVVEDAGVEGDLLRHLLAEFVAFEHLAVLLAVREPELDPRGVPLK